jgi:ubiquinone/menaquinone biosynthesis C-methylase UbiE
VRGTTSEPIPDVQEGAVTTHAQDQITKFWSMVAPGYEDRGSNVAEHGTDEYQRWLDAVGAVLPDQPADVLDLATGTGFLALVAAELGHRVTGIDLSTEMLSLAERTARERGLAVRFGPGDAVDPDLAPRSVDVVTNRHLLWTLREPGTAMANWLRILRPGGLVLSVDGHWFANEGSKDPASPNVFDRYYSPATRAALPFMPLDDTGPIVETFERAGYSDVRAEYLPALTNIQAGATPYFIVARP